MLGLVLGAARSAPSKRRPSVLAQSDEKLIAQNKADNEPVELSSLRVKGVKLRLGHTFSAISLVGRGGGQGDDWLENLEFNLENTSDKQITFVRIALLFPEHVGTGLIGVYKLLGIGIPPALAPSQPQAGMRRYGPEIPTGPNQGPPSADQPLALDPGDTITFRLSPQHFDQIKGFLSLLHYQLGDLNKVWIKIEYVIFNDETKWENGHYFRHTPEGPRQWEPIDRLSVEKPRQSQ